MYRCYGRLCNALIVAYALLAGTAGAGVASGRRLDGIERNIAAADQNADALAGAGAIGTAGEGCKGSRSAGLALHVSSSSAAASFAAWSGGS